VRIISGILKARRFSVPKNFPSRPTTDYAKEGLFNILEHKIDLFDLNILDLCAGTGNISFEFLSRQAGYVTAVDSNFNCIRFIKKNAQAFQVDEDLVTIKSDIIQFLEKTGDTYDLIFADPPYVFKQYNELVDLVFSRNLLNEDGILIIEHGKETSFEGKPHFDFCRNYGNVNFSFFKQEAP
jgi:16S rRNA (guanine966-N2)-methyltransferase